MWRKAAIVLAAFCASSAHAQWSDGFDRPDGGIGGNWTAVSGTWAVQGSRGKHTSAGNDRIIHNGSAIEYQNAAARVDCFLSDTTTQYSGIVIGQGASAGILVKLQAQSGTGNFSNIGIYNTATLGAWTGTTVLPDGSTSTAGFLNLPAGPAFSSARLFVSFPNVDVIRIDIDINFDGIPDLTYSRDGVTSIAAGMGKAAGVGCFGSSASFDNFDIASAKTWSDDFNRASGALDGNWTTLGGTWGVTANTGTHTGAANDQVQFTNASVIYARTASQLDVYSTTTALQYAGLVVGQGTDFILVKLQGQSGSGNFSHIGIYHNAGAWTGTTTLPGGGTDPGAFLALGTEISSARITVSFPSTDVVRVDLDTDFDGVPNYTYTRDGVSSISGSLGTGLGIGAFGDAVFDNWTVSRSRYDGFDRADGAIGGNWVSLGGAWAVSGNRGQHTSGAVLNENLQYGGASLPYPRSVTTMDCFVTGTGLLYSGPVIGLGGTEGILVKLQAQTGTGNFSSIGMYRTSTLSAWTGTTVLPDGTTSSAGFLTLPTGFPGAARVTVSFLSADVMMVELDTNFDGLSDYTYLRTGVSTIAAGLGTGYGLSAYGTGTVFDNWSFRQAGTWSETGDAGELPASAQATTPGSGPLAWITGNLTGQADMYRIRICDPASFSASTVGGATLDTQLFLFKANGTGIASNDDDPAGSGGQSRLSNAFTGSLTPGDYLLAISGYNYDPTSGGQLIWANTPFNTERAPDGPGAAGAVNGWTGSGDVGPYTIALTGVCFAAPVSCYANCDGSTAVPFLNVNDFICFNNRFAAGDPYANCDGSTLPPVLNVNDFICFNNLFAAGCATP